MCELPHIIVWRNGISIIIVEVIVTVLWSVVRVVVVAGDGALGDAATVVVVVAGVEKCGAADDEGEYDFMQGGHGGVDCLC